MCSNLTRILPSQTQCTFFGNCDAKERQSFDCQLRAGPHHLDHIEQMVFTQVEQVALGFYWANTEIQAFGDATDLDFNFLAQILELVVFEPEIDESLINTPLLKLLQFSNSKNVKNLHF